MRNIYFDNDISHPEGLNSDENHSWLARMVGAASVHVAPEVWERIRKETMEDVLKQRMPKKEASSARN